MRKILIIFLTISFMFSCGTDSKVVKKDKKNDKIEKKDDKNNKNGDKKKVTNINNSDTDDKKNGTDNDNKNVDNKNGTDTNNDNKKENENGNKIEDNNFTSKEIDKVDFKKDEVSTETIDKFIYALKDIDLNDENYKQKVEDLVILLFHTNELKKLKEIFKMDLDLTFSEKIQYIKTRVKNSSVVNDKKIGVIIPKKSKYKKFAIDIKNGIFMAKKDLNLDIEIVIKETDGSKDETLKVAEELIFEDNVSTIIGTIKSSNSKKVAYLAERYKIPFIAITNSTNISKLSKYTFTYFISIENISNFLAKYAIEKMKLKTFAIFYPNSNYGKTSMIHFWKAVEKNGGKITSIQSYSNNEKDYINPSKKLVGRYYLNQRYDYIAKKNKIKKEYSGYKLQKQLEALNKDIAPVVNFDAVFIPDNAKKVALILPYLALYDINFKTSNTYKNFVARQKAKDKNYKLKFVQLIGTQLWAFSDVILKASADYVEGAIFPIPYHISIKDKKVASFTAKYIKNYKKRPSILALYSYEIVQILQQIFTKLETTESIRDKIVESLLIQNFSTVTGETKFKYDGNVNKSDMFIMKFTKTKFKEIN